MPVKSLKYTVKMSALQCVQNPFCCRQNTVTIDMKFYRHTDVTCEQTLMINTNNEYMMHSNNSQCSVNQTKVHDRKGLARLGTEPLLCLNFHTKCDRLGLGIRYI